MADSDFKKRYWGRLQQLQKEHLAARKAGDFALAKKKREDIRRIAAVPFDSYIRKVDGVPRAKGLGPANPVNPESEPEQEPDDIGEGDADQEPQFGQDVDRVQEEQGRTAGQQQADELNKANIEQTTVKPEKEAPPGGLARGTTGTEQKGPDFKGAEQGLPQKPRTGVGGAIQNAGDKVKEAAKVAAEQVKKAVKKAIATAAKKAITAFFASPYGWPITLGCLGLILVAIIIAIFIGMVYGNHSTISTTGSTFVQPTNPLTDKEWIQRILLFSKDDSVTKALSDTALSGLEVELGEIKKLSQYSDKVAQIDLVLQEVTAYKNKPLASRTEEDGKKLIGDIKALVVSLLSVAVMPPSMAECTSEFCLKPTIGGSIHFGSPLNPCNADVKNGKNCPKPPHSSARTFIQFVQNTCDAVDLNAPEKSVVNALFGGEVVDDRTKSGLQIKSGIYTAVYAHLNQEVKKGQTIPKGARLGTISSAGHVHFELMGNGQCVVVTRSEFEAGRKEGKTEQAILWAKMKAVMGI